MQEATAQGKPTLPPAKEERRISRRKLLGNASVVGLGLAGAALGGAFAYDKLSGGPTERTTGLLRENVTTSFNPTLESPVIAEGAYIDSLCLGHRQRHHLQPGVRRPIRQHPWR